MLFVSRRTPLWTSNLHYYLIKLSWNTQPLLQTQHSSTAAPSSFPCRLVLEEPRGPLVGLGGPQGPPPAAVPLGFGVGAPLFLVLAMQVWKCLSGENTSLTNRSALSHLLQVMICVGKNIQNRLVEAPKNACKQHPASVSISKRVQKPV